MTTEEQRKELEELARPIMKYLKDNYHPYAYVHIDYTTASLSFKEFSFYTEDYISG